MYVCIAGYGLGFIVYPEAANYLPPPQLWCALFFFMSIFLGIDSQVNKYTTSLVHSLKHTDYRGLHICPTTNGSRGPIHF